MNQSTHAIEALDIIEKLRQPEGASVTIHYPNPDFTSPQECVEVSRDFGETTAAYRAGTLIEALRSALQAHGGTVSQPGAAGGYERALSDNERAIALCLADRHGAEALACAVRLYEKSLASAESALAAATERLAEVERERDEARSGRSPRVVPDRRKVYSEQLMEAADRMRLADFIEVRVGGLIGVLCEMQSLRMERDAAILERNSAQQAARATQGGREMLEMQERLAKAEREAAGMREALTPFAKVAEKYGSFSGNALLTFDIGDYDPPTVGDLRRARALLYPRASPDAAEAGAPPIKHVEGCLCWMCKKVQAAEGMGGAVEGTR